MSRLDDLAARMHPLLREGDLIRAMLAPPAVAAEIVTEDLIEIGRAHRFDDALELAEAARLGALLGIRPEPWQTLPLYREWLHATRDAMLQGSVTHGAIEGFAQRYAAAHESATGLQIGPDRPVLVENPLRRRLAEPEGRAMAPLAQMPLVVATLADTPVSFLLTGRAEGPEAAPLLANLATGQALLWRGVIPPGAQLGLHAGSDGGVIALLDGLDVSDRLVGLTGFTPGEAWSPAQVSSKPAALTLRHGTNMLWFLPIALYDTAGLDRFLFALPDLALAPGRWDQSLFDDALFDLPAAICLLATWAEHEPAAIALRVPAGLVLRPADAPGSAEADRERLAGALDTGLQKLKAAGIRATTVCEGFASVQPALDRITAILPLNLKDAGASGGERLPDASGLWGVTSFENSTFG